MIANIILITFAVLFFWFMYANLWLNAYETFTWETESTQLISKYERFKRHMILFPLYLIAKLYQGYRIIRIKLRQFMKTTS